MKTPSYAASICSVFRLLGPLASVALAACSAGTTINDGGDSGMATSDARTSRVPAKHRAAGVACPELPRNVPEPGTTGRGSATDGCTKHADCTTGRNGQCVFGRTGATCNYDECVTDAECTDKQVCQCDFGGSSGPDLCLLYGNCRTDSECGSAGYCSPSLGSCGNYGGLTGYFCHTATDECVDDADCSPSATSGGPAYCAFDEAVAHWKCSTAQCAG